MTAVTLLPAVDPGPYQQAAALYWQAGWHGVLPLPLRAKKNPPPGYTGQAGAWPSYADIYTWAEGAEGHGNIALRLPHHVLGVDVDNYDGKPGAATLADAERRWGPLPATWRTTSRDDGASGIRLFRVPEGLAWPGEIGPATEIIQHRHRYAVVWPSLHPEGRTYRWITPEGAVSAVLPQVDDLPSLPDEWIGGLTGGQLAADTERADLSSGQAGSWLLAHDGDGTPCQRINAAGHAAAVDFAGHGSTHEAGRSHTMRIVRLAEQGHPGCVHTLRQARLAFMAEVTNPSRPGDVRDPRTAEHEWVSLVQGAVNLVVPTPSRVTDDDPCANPFGGLISEQRPNSLTATLTAPATLTQQQEGGDGQEAAQPRERTSWWPRDLTAVIAGQDDEPAPTHLARTDGVSMFYAGRVNGLLGESESGKTWVALIGVTQALGAAQQVLYLDFEDTAAGIVNRLIALGSTPGHLDRLRYIGPDEALHALAAADLAETLQTVPPLIVLDGYNAAMTLLGLELESNTDATKFAQLLLKPLAATGATVVTIDHVPKNKENRGKGGIGAQAKRAMTTGCAIAVEVQTPFGRGMTGRLRLTVDKDRPGHVRGAASGARHIGTAILISDQDAGTVRGHVEPPEFTAAPGQRIRPTTLMERVCHFLATIPDGVSSKAIEDGVTGKREYVRVAVDTLVDEGYVSRHSGSRGEITHRLERVYRIADDLDFGVSDDD